MSFQLFRVVCNKRLIISNRKKLKIWKNYLVSWFFHQKGSVFLVLFVLVELQESIQSNKEIEKTNQAKAKKIENEIKNSKNTRDQKIKEAESEMKRLKKEAENSKKLWKEKEQVLNFSLNIPIEFCLKSCAGHIKHPFHF